MLIFAWTVLALSAIALLLYIILAFAMYKDSELLKILLCGIFPSLLALLGSMCYIFGFSSLPYSLIIGLALGSAFISFIVMSHFLLGGLNWGVVLCVFPSFVSFVFFVLAAVQHLWPHLITF